jgi:single-stranded-DNA-specific exonuclease
MNERLFLGIRSSATGMKWVDRLGLREANTALAIAQNYGIPDLVSRVMAGRGVGLEAAEEFLNPSIRSLMPDPLTLTDMKQAAVRIADAIQRRENVAIFGDYDVDGACSSALLSRFLTAYGVKNLIYIPDRIFEGYGPNPDAMRELVTNGGLRHQQRCLNHGCKRCRCRCCGAGSPPAWRCLAGRCCGDC